MRAFASLLFPKRIYFNSTATASFSSSSFFSSVSSCVRDSAAVCACLPLFYFFLLHRAFVHFPSFRTSSFCLFTRYMTMVRVAAVAAVACSDSFLRRMKRREIKVTVYLSLYAKSMYTYTVTLSARAHKHTSENIGSDIPITHHIHIRRSSIRFLLFIRGGGVVALFVLCRAVCVCCARLRNVCAAHTFISFVSFHLQFFFFYFILTSCISFALCFASCSECA